MRVWPCYVSPIVALAATGAAASAQTLEPPTAQVGEQGAVGGDIIVTGTRLAGISQRESPSPIQVFSAAELEKSGNPNLLDSMSRLIPSFNMENSGGDTGNLTLGAQLRGLNPNHVLVLVNGRRRHVSANFKVTGGLTQGSQVVDLGLIPPDAIERIEVLQDGAAAQYGSDAIAGVINIILKKGASGGSLGVTAGQYYEGDGETVDASINHGFALGQSGFLNLTAEYRFHDFSNRTGPDPRILVGNPYVGKIFGDARNQPFNFAYNAGYDLGGAEIYSFGTYSHRRARSNQNYRPAAVAPSIYPQGFVPVQAINEDDISVSAGVRGGDVQSLRWDLSTTYGADYNRIDVLNTINTDLLNATGRSPTEFLAGRFAASQWTTNLELGKAFDLGLAEPLNILVGAEYRHETYKLTQGDAAGQFGAGPQSYAAFKATDESDNARNVTSGYVDIAAQMTQVWQVAVAGRYEHYNDAGDNLVGKFTTRYDFSPAFAVRGTASTGFRAPTLAQQFYSATSVTPSLAILQLPANSPAAASLGAKPLKPEKSANFSLGVVLTPLPQLSLTVDAYQIKIRDRIVNTGYLFGPQIANAISLTGAVLDPSAFAIAQFFTNAIDTRTRGLDVTAAYSFDVGQTGKLNASLGLNLNKTKILHIDDAPSQLRGLTLFDVSAQSLLTQTSPTSKTILGLDFKQGAFSITLREAIYGKQKMISPDQNTGGFPYYTNTNGTKGITDIELGYDATSRLHLAVGANNLFDVYPDPTIPESRSINTNVYFNTVPYGFNGGYYYLRARFVL